MHVYQMVLQLETDHNCHVLIMFQWEKFRWLDVKSESGLELTF